MLSSILGYSQVQEPSFSCFRGTRRLWPGRRVQESRHAGLRGSVTAYSSLHESRSHAKFVQFVQSPQAVIAVSCGARVSNMQTRPYRQITAPQCYGFSPDRLDVSTSPFRIFQQHIQMKHSHGHKSDPLAQSHEDITKSNAQVSFDEPCLQRLHVTAICSFASSFSDRLGNLLHILECSG